MFDTLFSPIRIGRVALGNRIVMAPLETNFATTEGEMNRRVISFYEERAKGGVGLILTEGMYVDITGKARLNQFSITGDALVPGLTMLTDAVHRHGSKIFAQLAHAGRQTTSAISGHQPLAPSPIACKCSVCHEVPKELSPPEIERLAQCFAQGARRAKHAGFDGVEIHGAHGYLIHSFFSPHTNKRNDAYGGDAERRSKLPLEVARRIREEVGSSFPVLYRISAVEFLDDGVKVDDAIVLAGLLEKNGIDALDVSAGIYESGGICPYMDHPRAHLREYAKQVKQAVGVPVITVGGINDPSMAEDLLNEGVADLVAFGRLFFSDPHWPSKTLGGRSSEITRCLRCNVCLERLFVQESVVCVVNPALGNEVEYELRPSTSSKTVLVIGGGLAGMTAARVCALRGHKVVLCEREKRLGGQVLLADKIRHKSEFTLASQCLQNQIDMIGVDIRLGCTADMNTVNEIRPDAVVLATGAVPTIPKILGRNLMDTVTSFDVLAEQREIGESVLVAGGGLVGAETAIFLAEKGKHVTISSWGARDDIAKGASFAAQAAILSDFSKYNVEVATNVSLNRIEPRRVVLDVLNPRTRTKMGTETVVEDLDAVVFAYDLVPEVGMHESLESRGYVVHAVGDCVQPRSALHAIHEAYQVALQI